MITLENVFGDDADEALDLIRFEDFEGATNVKDELEYNEGWYGFSSLTFDYKDKRYYIEYKEHNSDNVCDFEYLYDTFNCLGPVSEMDNTINMEDLSKERAASQRRSDVLENKIKKLQEEKNVMERKLGKLSSLSKEQTEYFSKMFYEANEESKSKNTIYEVLGEFFELVAKDKGK